jgi:hypothetical protein
MLARVLTAAGAATALAIFGAAPAHAQAQPTVGAFLNDVTIPTAGPGAVERVILSASEPVQLNNMVLTFDFSDIASFATVAKGSQGASFTCTLTAPAVLTCQSPFPTGIGTITGILPEIVIAPTASAALGNEGILRVTVDADEIAPASHDARVRTGTPVNLAAGPPADREAAFGGSFTHTVQVKNAGANAVDGVALMLDNDPAFRAGAKFSNCTYAGERPRTCRFDQVLSPGVAYQVAIPYVVGLDTLAPSHQFAEYQWLTAADFEDALNQLAVFDFDLGEPGPSGTLELTEVGAPAAQSIDTDVQPNNNWTSLSLSVTGHNDTDLAAVGARLTGGVGDLVTAAVGMKNNGPASVDRGREGSSVAQVHVIIPPGTTAVTVPQTCMPEAENGQVDFPDRGQPGQPRYFCAAGSSFLGAGVTETFEFTLRIDQVIPDAAGTVSILDPCQCSELPLAWDRDHSNNTADIVVNPTAVADGSALPATGNRVGLIVGLGGMLILLGAVTVALAMRRRLPFARRPGA